MLHVKLLCRRPSLSYIGSSFRNIDGLKKVLGESKERCRYGKLVYNDMYLINRLRYTCSKQNEQVHGNFQLSQH